MFSNISTQLSSSITFFYLGFLLSPGYYYCYPSSHHHIPELSLRFIFSISYQSLPKFYLLIFFSFLFPPFFPSLFRQVFLFTLPPFPLLRPQFFFPFCTLIYMIFSFFLFPSSNNETNLSTSPVKKKPKNF